MFYLESVLCLNTKLCKSLRRENNVLLTCFSLETLPPKPYTYPNKRVTWEAGIRKPNQNCHDNKDEAQVDRLEILE